MPNTALNRVGLQVARLGLAHAMHRVRRHPIPPDVAAHLATLRRDGIVMIPEFLPSEEFGALRREFFDVWRDYPERFAVVDGDNNYRFANLDAFGGDLIPQTSRLLRDARLRGLFEGAEKAEWNSCIMQAGFEGLTFDGPNAADPQATFHSDTFHHTHKAWLYMDDVDWENGPLTVIRGTHRLSLGMLRPVYAHSIDTGGHASRRIRPNELTRLGEAETVATCAKNTLVIANTHAYHRRREGVRGATRFAIHISTRAAPFRVRFGPGRR